MSITFDTFEEFRRVSYRCVEPFSEQHNAVLELALHASNPPRWCKYLVPTTCVL